MARADKVATVDDIADEFRSSSGAVLTEYRGLSVAQLKELRRALGEHATYAVVKNTLTKLAADQAGVTGVSEHLVGPTAIAFVKGDVVEAARGLRDFARANAMLVIKGGVLDGRVITTAEIAKLADLESRDTLLARLAGGMTASLQQAVSLFAAPLSQAARALAALEQKRSDEEPDAAPVPDAAAEPSEPGPSEPGPSDAAAEPSDAAAEPSDAAAEPGPSDAAPSEPAPAEPGRSAAPSAGLATDAPPAAAETPTEAAPAAGPSDAGSPDAGPSDAGPSDAGPSEPGPSDVPAGPSADIAADAAPAAEPTDQG